jgi:TrmH family RNA methyltransferase
VPRRSTITSSANDRLKAVRRLARGRDASVFLVEGHRQLRRALEGRAAVRAVYAAPELFLGDGDPGLVALAAERGAEVVELGARAFRSISSGVRPDGLLAVVERWPTGIGALRLHERPLLLVAQGIERPGNLGTIVRTACGAGVDAVVVCDGPTGAFHPDAVQGSVGALFRMQVVHARTEQAIAWLGARGIAILVASPDAESRYWEVDCSGAVALVVGSERHGVSGNFRDAAAGALQIPMGAGVDSLNVAVATGIVLFEAARQRAASAGCTESARRTAARSSGGRNGFRTSSAPSSEPSVSGA